MNTGCLLLDAEHTFTRKTFTNDNNRLNYRLQIPKYLVLRFYSVRRGREA